MDVSWQSQDAAFRWPWLMVALAAGVIVLLAIGWRAWSRRAPADATYVAHAARLSALPRFQSLVRRRTALGAALSLAALVACSGAILLAGRYQETQTKSQDEASRDIMLCLDSSGSMAAIDAEVVAQFQEIVKELQGERIGLTIWSGTAITVFPLTDDYEFALEQLRAAKTAFDTSTGYGDAYLQFVEGTVVNEDVASQMGDGLVSCVQRFDRDDEDRSRAIVLASDNEPFGRGVYTVPEAADYAAEHHVVVHGIAAPTISARGYAATEFEQQVIRTGGTYSLLGADGSVSTVVEAINELEAKKIEKPPVVQTLDRPQVGTAVTAVGVGLLALVWLAQGALALAERTGRD